MDQDFLDKLVTRKRAEAIALELFPDDYRADPTFDCMMEVDRHGLPCRCCADANKAWQDRIVQVRAAVQKGFS